MDGGNSRVVCMISLLNFPLRCNINFHTLMTHRFQRRRLKLGVLQRETFPTLRPLLRRHQCERSFPVHCQECSEDRRRGRAVSFQNSSIHVSKSRVWSQTFSLLSSLGTCQTQSTLGQAINRDLQGVNAKWVYLSPRRMLLSSTMCFGVSSHYLSSPAISKVYYML